LLCQPLFVRFSCALSGNEATVHRHRVAGDKGCRI
jgi:hypothetical protein